MHITHITELVVAGDYTSGRGSMILNHLSFMKVGQPETVIREDNGFGYRIPHHVTAENPGNKQMLHYGGEIGHELD
jgi:hypothetical protein